MIRAWWNNLPDGDLGAARPILLAAIFCMGITFLFFTLAALIVGQWFAVIIFGIIVAARPILLAAVLAFKTVKEQRP